MKNILLFSFSFIGKIGFSVAIPLVAFALLGRYIDNRLGTHPYFFMSGIIIATIIVYLILRKLIKDTIEQFNKMNKIK